MTVGRVEHIESEDRYVLRQEGRVVGELTYRNEPQGLALDHTFIEPELRMQGLAGELVGGALADIRSRGMRVIPECPFVATYFRRHPDQADLLVDGPFAEACRRRAS